MWRKPEQLPPEDGEIVGVNYGRDWRAWGSKVAGLWGVLGRADVRLSLHLGWPGWIVVDILLSGLVRYIHLSVLFWSLGCAYTFCFFYYVCVVYCFPAV